MDVTRRYWGVVAVAAALAAGGVVLARPLPVVGAATVAAWLLTVQYLFVRDLQDADAALAIEQALTPGTVAVDATATATLRARLDGATPLELEVRARPPVGVEVPAGDSLALRPTPGETTTAYTVTCRTAGEQVFRSPVVEARDRRGLFAETVARGPERRLAVEPHSGSEVHVGQGGEGIAITYGSHRSDRRGAGDEPAEIRQYVTGDAADRIDWKASARLGEPYVREFEVETDLPTTLVVDHRASLGVGTSAETALDALREVALSVVAAASDDRDPLGLVTVGDDGVTGRLDRTATDTGYRRIHDRLQVLSPTDRGSGRSLTTGPADASAAAARLDGDDAFAGRLRPYFEPAAYVTRLASDPLFAAVRAGRDGQDGRTVVCTDDGRPAELREAVKYARRRGRVVVFLAPSALFAPGGLADLEVAYDRYREFERLRRSLAELDRVTVYEVAPADRLDAVQSVGRERRAADRQS
jgi:uncharacterized protein (DUF58 family)